MRCSESLFNNGFFAPFQLAELSVKEFIYLLVSSSHLNVAIIVSKKGRDVNTIFKISKTLQI